MFLASHREPLAANRIADVHVRPFERDDQAAIRRLILEGLGEHFGFIDETINPDLADIHHHYIWAGDTFLVATTGDEIVGAVALSAENESVGRLERMSVALACRRRGIATALVGHLVTAAQERNFSRMVLAVQVPWIEAIGFYESCGFVEYARDEVHVHMELHLE